jgi:tRNA (guanosine-2'-O-)-methyltransferase
MPLEFPDDAWEKLSPRISDNRRTRLLNASAKKTDYIRLVLQDIHNEHNVSACVRSAEAFGVLNVDVVNTHEKFSPTSVARGSGEWLRLRLHKDISQFARELKSQGYRLIGGYPKPNATKLAEISLAQPTAVLFGNEHDGLDGAWLEHLDEVFTIPMDGLVESLNISVSCAISLYELTKRAKVEVPPAKYFLNDSKRKTLLNEWICLQTKDFRTQLDLIARGPASYQNLTI